MKGPVQCACVARFRLVAPHVRFGRYQVRFDAHCGLLNLETRLDACFSPLPGRPSRLRRNGRGRRLTQVQVHPFNLSQLITQTRNPTAFCALLAFYGDCPPSLPSASRSPSLLQLALASLWEAGEER